MLISIDGIDCVGKSTLAAAIAEYSGGTIVRGVGEPYKAIEEPVITRVSIDGKFLFYLSAYIHSAIQAVRTVRGHLIFDRSLYSVIAYHRALGATVDVQNLFSVAPVPDVRIFLTCPKERWLRVLGSKERLDWYESRILGEPRLANAIEREYRALGLQEIENRELAVAIDRVKGYLGKVTGVG